MPLAPPKEGLYPSWPDCEQAIQAHARDEGYAIVSMCNGRNKRTGQYNQYAVKCDRYGTFKSNATQGLRRTTSKKTGCQFRALASIKPDGCHFRVIVAEHNHPPSASPAEHAQHRKLTEPQRRFVEERAAAGDKVSQVLQALRAHFPDSYAKNEDVGNHIQAWKKRNRDGATPLQSLLYRLVAREDIWSFPLERAGVLAGAFWVPRWSQDLWSRAPDVLVIMSDHVGPDSGHAVVPATEMASVVAAGAGLGAGYAVLPDKSDATVMWLHASVERLRVKLNAPKPAYVTVTDFRTGERNMIAEVNKTGYAHRQTHVVFGRIIEEPAPAPLHASMSGPPMSGPMSGSMSGPLSSPISGPISGPLPGPASGPAYGPTFGGPDAEDSAMEPEPQSAMAHIPASALVLAQMQAQDWMHARAAGQAQAEAGGPADPQHQHQHQHQGQPEEQAVEQAAAELSAASAVMDQSTASSVTEQSTVSAGAEQSQMVS